MIVNEWMQSPAISLIFKITFSVPKEEPDPTVLAEKAEEERKVLERREWLYQAYLKRKENGKRSTKRSITSAAAFASSAM